ncbi:unnamed protein product [Porites evermanni]|uniref:Retrotransposon gag domain-containing protein n=1 Tax=Porites evermanni TaxID=104178 RepID=A0ABN8SDM4_9CNID|nr:unnamed protein product [Porites evermanni]
MKLYPKSDLKNSDKTFDLLQESFGEKRSVPQLLKAFYDRRQREGETLRAFSQALRELQAKIEKKSVTKSSGQDAALRDHFAENVRDIPSFKRNLRNLSEHTRKFPFQTPERKLFAGLKKTRSPYMYAVFLTLDHKSPPSLRVSLISTSALKEANCLTRTNGLPIQLLMAWKYHTMVSWN